MLGHVLELSGTGTREYKHSHKYKTSGVDNNALCVKFSAKGIINACCKNLVLGSSGSGLSTLARGQTGLQ